jgi:hypothetical protein
MTGVKPSSIDVDEVRVSSVAAGLAPRVYRIKPWPVRIGAPLLAAIVVQALLHAGAGAAVPIPIVLAAVYIYLAERCGLVVTSDRIKSRMTRRENTFSYAWTEIDGFDLVGDGAQVAIVMRLRDGSRKLLPSTRAWLWDKRKINQIYTALEQEQTAAHAI